VLLHGEPGEIEFIDDVGVMIVEPKVFGRLLIKAPVSQYEDLEFVSRGS